MILVLGSVRLRPDGFDEAFALSRAHVVRSRAEPGCVAHAVHRDDDDATRLVFVERWSDMDALSAHFGVPASRAFGKRLAALALDPPTIEIFDAAPMPLPTRGPST